MGRYTGPVERLSRREGVDLGLKGERALLGKGAIERRGDAPPGQHGRRVQRRQSVYGEQLREKQKCKRVYGLREKQFRRLVRESAKRSNGEVHGEALLGLLERRLDNALYRLGFATTRQQARQFVSHGHVLVNGAKCDIASRRVAPGDVVAIRPGAAVDPLVESSLQTVERVASWLQADVERREGRILHAPTRDEIDTPVAERLIIEFYSRS